MISVEEVVVGLRSLEIVTDEEIERLRIAAGRDAGAAVASNLISGLVERGKLTPYQGQQFLKSRWRQLALGDYLLLKKIGEGGMGQVFLALHQVSRPARGVLPI